MLKWYADNTELSTEKGKPNVLLFGGVVVDSKSEKQIEKLLRDVKDKYTYPTLPIKWNFKDLKENYIEWNRLEQYETLLKDSYKWRTEIVEKSLRIDYKIILAAIQRYPSDKPLKIIKEQLTGISFSQVLMRVGLFASNFPSKESFEIILDWPDGSNPKPFNREYFRAYNLGKSSSNVPYHCGPLSKLGFKDSVYFAKSTHSTVLQFADIVIGAAKDFIIKTTQEIDHSLGYDLTVKLLPKYRGFPDKIIEYGLNFSPRNNKNYQKLKTEIKNNAIQHEPNNT
jgi:hypothetical protein